LSQVAAGHLIDSLSVAMLILAFGVVWTRSLRLALLLFAAQSVMLAIAAFSAGLATSTTHILIGAALTFGVKGAAIPALLWLIVARTGGDDDVPSGVSQRSALAIAIVIAVAFAMAFEGGPFRTAIGAQRVLPTSVTMVALGLLVMVTHRPALSQIIGFLVIENGMALAALTATYGMPLVVELGISLDLLSALLVAFAFTGRMHAIFGSLDTHHLRSLRG
jgi:hydrogenase-4 component E